MHVLGWRVNCIHLFCIVVFIEAHVIYDPRDSGYAKDQRRLIRFLTNKTFHDTRARPVEVDNNPINVTIRMNLYQIIDVDERNQFVIVYAWMTQMWKDVTVAWEPQEYSNITMVVLPYTDIWLPDTYLYNNVEMVREEAERWINAIVEMYPDEDPGAALVTFRYPALYKFTCSLEMTYFPFDRQLCTMAFGSWTYDATGIDFFPEKELVAREDFSESEEWQVISFKAYRELERYACCPQPFSLLRQHLVMKRKPLHYIVNLIIPTVIISVISTVGFFTPSTTTGERTEKVNLGIATLLAFAILLLMVADQMPSTSQTMPLISWFLLGIMAQTAFGTLGAAATMLVHNRGQKGKRVSPIVRRIFFNTIARLFCVEMPPRLEPKVVFDLPTSSYSIYQPSLAETSDLQDIPSGERYREYQRQRRRSRLSITGIAHPIRDRRPPMAMQARRAMAMFNEDEIAYLEHEWLADILDSVILTATLMGVFGISIGTLAVGFGHAFGE